MVKRANEQNEKDDQNDNCGNRAIPPHRRPDTTDCGGLSSGKTVRQISATMRADLSGGQYCLCAIWAWYAPDSVVCLIRTRPNQRPEPPYDRPAKQKIKDENPAEMPRMAGAGDNCRQEIERYTGGNRHDGKNQQYIQDRFSRTPPAAVRMTRAKEFYDGSFLREIDASGYIDAICK